MDEPTQADETLSEATQPDLSVTVEDTPSGATSGGLLGAPVLSDYRITGRLGEGGMGVVWKAEQRSTRRVVALKVLAAATLGSEKARVRFEREVELSARLEDERIARVYDAGVENGVPYYAMQLVEGVPLDHYIEKEKHDRRAILGLMRSVCEAVQHAHQRGIIHRDLKPSNILVRPDGEPVVLDFGLAKAISAGDDSSAGLTLSEAGQVAGTPAYMSPEQAAGRAKEADTRSDVYTLGVILYRLLTGRSPHDLSGSTLDVLRRIANQEVSRPRRTRGPVSRGIDAELETVLLKALERDPDRRYDSAGQLALDLGNYLSGDPLQARPITTLYLLRKRANKHRKTLAAAALIVLTAIGLTAYAYLRPGTYALDSTPRGANLLINGQRVSGCTTTPCEANLGFGTHEVRFSHPGYEDAVRRVTIRWGRPIVENWRYAAEPVPMVPTSRFVEFRLKPPSVGVIVRNKTSGETVANLNAGSSLKLPEGSYTLSYTNHGEPVDQSPESLQVISDLTPIVIRRDFGPSE